MVNLVSGIINGLNVGITLTAVIYTMRIRGTYKGETFRSSLSTLIGSAFFFFLAALVRAGLIWNLLTIDFEPLELGVRSIAFILLLVFAMRYFKEWRTFDFGRKGKSL